MGSEFLTPFGFAILFVTVIYLARLWIVRDRRFIEKNIKDRNDFRQYAQSFSTNAYQLQSSLNHHLAAASNNLHAAKVWRKAAELSIRHIEMLLVEQDKLGFITSGSELDVLHRQQFLDRDQTSFIKSQHVVHVHVEKVRDCIFEMQRLSKEVSDWIPGRSSHIQEACSSLVRDLERDANHNWEETDRILCDADRDPVGIEDELVSPKVIEFRKELESARSKLRASLAAEK